MNLEPTLSDCARAIQQFIEQPRADGGAMEDSQFDTHARQIFEQQLRLNTPYRLFCQRLGRVPTTISHWSEIPAMPAAAFKELDVSCLLPTERTTSFHSSGTTTQQPSRHYHSQDSLRLYEASAFHWFVAHFAPGPSLSRYRCLCLTPSPALAPHSSLVHMFETIRKRGAFASFDYAGTLDAEKAWALDLNAVTEILTLPTTTPLLLLGTAFSYLHLLDHFAARPLRIGLPAGSVALETGGYKGRSRVLPKAELHRFIQAALSPNRILCEYGMSELSSQAYDLSVGNSENSSVPAPAPPPVRIFRFPAWARARVISPEDGQEVRDGETGLIRVVDLANVYSVVALQTEDLAIRRGTGFELLGRAAGAENRGCSLTSSVA